MIEIMDTTNFSPRKKCDVRYKSGHERMYCSMAQLQKFGLVAAEYGWVVVNFQRSVRLGEGFRLVTHTLKTIKDVPCHMKLNPTCRNWWGEGVDMM